MAKTNNPYANLLIDRDSIEEAIKAAGGTSFKILDVGTQKHLCFEIEGQKYRISAFFNKDGKTTLSKQTGFDEVIFTKVADSIKTTCAIGPGGRLDLSIPRFPADDLERLLEYLVEQKAEVELDERASLYRRIRLSSKQGDVLTVKHHVNLTLQLQGTRAMLAAMALDMLSSVMDYESLVSAQLETFEVPMKIRDVEDEFEGKWAKAFTRCPTQVKAQLISALALTKLNVKLPDYGPVAFPALRGLEGFMKVELDNAGLNVTVVDSFGEYFEKNPTKPSNYQLRAPHQAVVGIPLANEIAKCYTFYKDERHGLAHAGVSALDTRMLPTLTDARNIVIKTLDTIDTFCHTIES